MTTNTIRSQGNRQNIQLHPKDDPSIAFHHTFELSLSQKDKQVRIIDDNEVVGKIPLKAFWNSQQCDDQSYYRIHILDMNNSSDQEAWILKNPLLNKTLERNNKDTAYKIVGEIVNEVTKLGSSTITDTGNSKSFTIKEKEIPELAKNHQVRYAQEMEFKFVKNGNDCAVLTVQGANSSNSDISIDLPSKACVHTDDGKLQCSNLGSVREIKKPDGSTKYYMTMTRDKDGHYKYYFSDKNGKNIDNLEFRLSDIRIINPTMLKILQSNHRVNELHEKSQNIDEKLTQHVADLSPSAVAQSLVESKGLELGNTILHAIESNPNTVVLSRLARDTNLQTKVAENLKQDATFQDKIKGKDGEAGSRGADGTPGKDANPAEIAAKLFEQPAQLGLAVLDIKGADQKAKLATELAGDDAFKKDVGDLLKGNIEKDVGSLPRMARSIQEYEKQSQSYEERIQGIEEKMEGEERKILEIKNEAISANTESMRHAESSRIAAMQSEEHAQRSETAANKSEGHAQESKAAADKSEEHAVRSETTANKSEGHAQESKAAADESKEHAQRSETEANRSEEHSDAALASSRSAASYASNVEEIASRGQQGGLSRHRREAVSEDSEDKAFQYDDSELSPTDYFSIM